MTVGKNNTIWDKLSNPLLLLIIGAVVTGILVPSFTRQWQDHQKELELKTDLVSRMSKTIVDFLTTAQFSESRSSIVTSRYYETAYLNWTDASAIIESQLNAYFPGTTLPQQWNNLSNITTDFYLLSANNTGVSLREQYLNHIHNYFSSTPNKVNWQGLADRKNVIQFHKSWFETYYQIRSRSNELVQNIVGSQISGFRIHLAEATIVAPLAAPSSNKITVLLSRSYPNPSLRNIAVLRLISSI